MNYFKEVASKTTEFECKKSNVSTRLFLSGFIDSAKPHRYNKQSRDNTIIYSEL
jgi:hypothetical protein